MKKKNIVINNTTESLTSITLIPTEKKIKKMIKMHEAAKSISEEKKIDESEVFDNDDLYAEATRRAFTPAEIVADFDEFEELFAKQAMPKVISSIFEQIRNVLINQLSTDNPEAIEKALDIDLSFSPELLMSDPSFRKMMEGTISDISQGIQKIKYEQLVRFWGENVVDGLAHDQKKKFPPDQIIDFPL